MEGKNEERRKSRSQMLMDARFRHHAMPTAIVDPPKSKGRCFGLYTIILSVCNRCQLQEKCILESRTVTGARARGEVE